MKLSKYISGSLCALLLVLLSACSTLGYIAPKTPAQRLAYVDTQIAVVVDKLADAREAGMLNQSQIKTIDDLVSTWQTTRTLAYKAAKGDKPEKVLDYLNLLENILVQLKAMQNE